MLDIKFLFKVSRPRFWLYVFGPYLVGLAAGATSKEDFCRVDSLLFGLFFLLPANLLIYGINDIFDFETDRLNPKKAKYELLVRPESHGSLVFWIVVLNLPFIVATCFLAPRALLSLAGFMFFSVFYSAVPVRAKEVPFMDSIFNILYVFPGAFAYQMLTGSFPPIVILFSAGLWTMAMHAYSAIADIPADKEAGIDTIATFLSKTGTLIFCLATYSASAIIAYPYLGSLAVVLGLVYVAMIGFSFISRTGIFEIYRYFPLLNTATGFVLFWFVCLDRFL